MELEIGKQAALLLRSLLLGLMLALIYDMLRPLRYRAGKAGALLLDLLFSAAAFFAAFSFAMGAGEGKLGQWELCGILLGFLLYIQLVGDAFERIFESLLQVLESVWGQSINLIKKAADYAKFFFKNVRECFIIKR